MRILRAVGEMTHLAFGPSSDILFASAGYRGFYVWDLTNYSCQTLNHITRFSGGPRSARDPHKMIFLDWRDLKIYDIQTKTLDSKKFAFPFHWIHAYEELADCDLVISTDGFDQTHSSIVRRSTPTGWEIIWSVRNTQRTRFFISPGGKQMLLMRYLAASNELDLCSTLTGAVEQSMTYPDNQLTHAEFSPDGKQFAALHEAKIVAYQLPELRMQSIYRNPSRKHFTNCAFHPSGRYLFATSNDSIVHVFNTQSLECVNQYSWNIGKLKSLALSPDGMLASAGSTGGRVVVWDLDL